MAQFDDVAESYDLTRGGERRGDDYAADIDGLLPPGSGPILEVGVGTGVVALGLARRGRSVIGLDISSPMLARASSRLGHTIVRSDALEMSIASASVAHAVSVWMVHSVQDPIRLFAETARVIRPGGHLIVSPVQRPHPDDTIGRIVNDMGRRVDERRGASRPRGVTVEEVLDWASVARFSGKVHHFTRRWISTPADELSAIELRAWPSMRDLSDADVEEVTKPAIEALRDLPAMPYERLATADIIDFEQC